jgi:hypothetical protein
MFPLEDFQRSAQVARNKTTGITIKDTEMENCLGKANFSSVDRCTGKQAQKIQGVDYEYS